MYKPDNNGIVRVEGAKAIAEAHSSPDLIEIGGNSTKGWAEFKFVGKQLPLLSKSVVEKKPVKKTKKDVKNVK